MSAEQMVAIGGRVATSLNAVTATGAGTGIDYGTARHKFALQTKTTGGPTGVSVTLEGSLNGTDWAILATSTSTTGDTQYAVDKPARYVRANLGTLTGGATPTVTAWVAGV